MTVDEILSKLVNEIHTTVIASNDTDGNPITSVIDMMLTENQKLYFLTAKEKNFYERLMRNGYVALSGIKGENTMSTVAISVHGKVRNIGKEKLDELFDLSCKPIFRQNFVLGNKEVEEHGFYITHRCKGCRACFYLVHKIVSRFRMSR